MYDFGHMSFEELVRPEGFECKCGKKHSVPIEYLKICRGATAYLPEALRAVKSKKPFIVCDKNTYEAAGKIAEETLEKVGIEYTTYVIPSNDGERIKPGEWELGSIGMHFDPGCDFILAVGGGVINDLCKVFGHDTGRKTGVLGTSPSMDGFASNSSSMEVNHVKVSLYNACPAVILCDTEVMAKAPMRNLWAGLGDMAAKYISICEWRISTLITGEYYCEGVAGMMRAALERIMAAAPQIPSRDPDAIQTVAEGLVLAGIAMSYAQISRPASGLEHYFSHVWEMLALERGLPYDLHGIQVGIGTVLSMKVMNRVRTIRPDPEKAAAAMRAFDPSEWEKNVRRVFGKTAHEIIAIEEKTHKNDPARQAAHARKICENWDQILKIIDEEIPDEQWLFDIFEKVGMPMWPKDIGVSRQDTRDAFVCSRDIRDKYLISSLLWEIGEMDEFADWVETLADGE